MPRSLSRLQSSSLTGKISSRPTRLLDTRIAWLLLSLCLVRSRPFRPVRVALPALPTPPFQSRPVVLSPSIEIDATRGSRVQSATGHRVRNVAPSVSFLFCLGPRPEHPLIRRTIPLLLPRFLLSHIQRSNCKLFDLFSSRYRVLLLRRNPRSESITCDIAPDGVQRWERKFSRRERLVFCGRNGMRKNSVTKRKMYQSTMIRCEFGKRSWGDRMCDEALLSRITTSQLYGCPRAKDTWLGEWIFLFSQDDILSPSRHK